MSAEIGLKREVHQLAWNNLQASVFPALTEAKVLANPHIHREVFGEKFESWRTEHGGDEGNRVGIQLTWLEPNQDKCSVEIISKPNGGFQVRGGMLGTTTLLPRSTTEYQRSVFEKACAHPTRVPLSPPPPQ